MIKNEKKIQVKKNARNIPINPKSTKTTREIRFHNKKSSNEPLSNYQQKVPSTIENNRRANNNKVPPNSERKLIREKSAEIMKYKTANKIQIKKKESQKQIKIRNQISLNSSQNNLKQEIGEIKSGIGEIKSEIGGVNNSINGLKRILTKGFEALFFLIQKNMKEFEEKRKEFQDSVEISNKSDNEPFNIIENKKEPDSTVNKDINTISNNESEKNSNNSHNHENSERKKIPKCSSSSSDSNNKENVLNYGKVKTSSDSYSINDTSKFNKENGQNNKK